MNPFMVIKSQLKRIKKNKTIVRIHCTMYSIHKSINFTYMTTTTIYKKNVYYNLLALR